MTKNVTSANVDFDDLFDPDVVGDGPSTSWLTSGGVPLKYAALAYGTKRANVGFADSANSDVSNLWAAKGTAVYTTAANGQTYFVGAGAFTNQSTARAVVQFTANTDGTFDEIETQNTGAPTTQHTGTWLPATGVASDYEIQFAVTILDQNGGTVSYTNSAAAYSPMTSAQTVSITATCPGNVAVDRNMKLSVVMRVRKIATGVVVSTSTFTMEADAVGYV